MFGLGPYEILVIAIVAVVIVGPKDLPLVLRTFFNFTAKAKSIAREFRRGIDELADEAGLAEVKKDLQSVAKGDIAGDLGKDFEELGDIMSGKAAANKIGGGAGDRDKQVANDDSSGGAGEIDPTDRDSVVTKT